MSQFLLSPPAEGEPEVEEALVAGVDIPDWSLADVVTAVAAIAAPCGC
jgi:hypothetical protein